MKKVNAKLENVVEPLKKLFKLVLDPKMKISDEEIGRMVRKTLMIWKKQQQQQTPKSKPKPRPKLEAGKEKEKVEAIQKLLPDPRRNRV